MKALTFLAFATIFLLSAALPEGKGKGHQRGLVEPEYAVSLQRRKPPVKIPGPAFLDGDSPPGVGPEELLLKRLANDEERKKVYLTKEKNKKHLDEVNNSKEKGKPKQLVYGDKMVENEEETQTSRSGGNSP